MAGVFRIGFSRIISAATATSKVPEVTLVRCISGKVARMGQPERKKPAPWDYENKPFRIWSRMFDNTTDRFDENTKIIVVDGPIASGKTCLAKALAEDFGMLYMPEANFEMHHINSYGFDLRTLNPKIPDSCRMFDIKDFCQHPSHPKSSRMQIALYEIRFSQYIDALAHVLSTGQGVVMDRSVYSDFVFLEAMRAQNYCSKEVRNFYNEMKKNSIDELMRPHLVIYLDVPVAKVIENIKKRGISYEVNSKALTPEYLESMEHFYKQKFLKDISTHSELLVYDWSNAGDVEVVVEDIERIDFDRFEEKDLKLADWRMYDHEDWAVKRAMYSDEKDNLETYLDIPNYDAPELIIDANDLEIFRQVYDNAPGEKYDAGYNAREGDKVLFKCSEKNHVIVPRVDRKIPCV